MTVVCSQGHANLDGAAFCDTCGEELTGIAPTVANAAAPDADRRCYERGGGPALSLVR